MLVNVTDVFASEGKVISKEIPFERTVIVHEGSGFPVKDSSAVSLKLSNTAQGKALVEARLKLSVAVPCDRCLDDLELPVNTDDTLKVKMGLSFSEEGDVLVVPEEDGYVNVAWFIYEFIALNIPAKHVHTPGKCNAAMIKVLEEHSATRSSGENEEAAVDPRWNELEKLKTIIKD